MAKIDWREYKDLKPEQKEREVFLMLRDIKDNLIDLKETNAREHKGLDDHAKKTNGRVTDLEDENFNIKLNIGNFKGKVIGALSILNIIVWPVVLWFITSN